jgi:hypothetical protein
VFTTTTVATLSIVTGKSPCTDSQYEKVVFSRTSEADYVIGKIKMKNILVINKLDRSNAGIRHIAMEDNKTEYESYMFYQRKFWDVRKTEEQVVHQQVECLPVLGLHLGKLLLYFLYVHLPILFLFLNFDYPQIRQFLLRIQSC